MPEPGRLCVSILNYRTPDLVMGCLSSLEAEIDPDHDRVVVLDNGSGDGSFDWLAEAVNNAQWTGWVTVLRSSENLGFSAGHNAVIHQFTADFYLLLNSDTVVCKDTLQSLLEAAGKNPGAGIITPRLVSQNGTPQPTCFRYPSPMSEMLWSAASGALQRLFGRFSEVVDDPSPFGTPDWTSFACTLLRRAAFEEVGDLDEGFFMYFEDVDYCRRIHAAGWDVLFWPYGCVTHLHSSKDREGDKVTRADLGTAFFVSRSRYFSKYHGKVGLLCANLMWILGRMISIFPEWLGIKQRQTAPGEWRAIWSGWNLPLRSIETDRVPASTEAHRK